MVAKGLLKALTLALTLGLVQTAQAADTLKIAVAAPLTGKAAAYGDNVKTGAELKVEEINKAGGVNGKKIELIYLDELCEPKEAATVANKIAQDDSILAVIGHVCSSAHLAALPTYVRKGIPAITATATNVTIGEKGKDRKGLAWSFRDVFRDDFQGRFLARYAAEALGLKKVAVFYENNDYGIGLKDAFVAAAPQHNLAVAGTEAYVSGAQDFTPQLTKIKGQEPDGLFIAGYFAEGALIADQAAKLGLKVVKFGADGLDNMDYVKLAKDAAENTYLTAPFLPEIAGPEAKPFLDAFKAKTGREADYMSANAYDAAGILAQAIAKAGPDRAKIRAYLAEMSTPDKGYQGITGLTTFDANGDTAKPAFVKMVKDGAFVAAPKQLK